MKQIRVYDPRMANFGKAIQGTGTARTLPGEEKPEHPEFIQDEKTGLLLPEGARSKQHPPGFKAWEE